MRKLLNKPWFVGVVALVALLFVAHSVFPGARNLGLGGADAAAASEAEGSTDDAVHPSSSALVSAMASPANVRDPFAVRVKPEVAGMEKIPEPDLIDTVHLSAIWTQDGQTLVLINNHIFQGGDELGRLKIESATPEGVWLTHWKGRDFLAIGHDFTLSTPARKFSPAAASL